MQYNPDPSHKFTFGLWTVGHIRRDPFGGPVREPLTPVELVHLLADVGERGFSYERLDQLTVELLLGVR